MLPEYSQVEARHRSAHTIVGSSALVHCRCGAVYHSVIIPSRLTPSPQRPFPAMLLPLLNPMLQPRLGSVQFVAWLRCTGNRTNSCIRDFLKDLCLTQMPFLECCISTATMVQFCDVLRCTVNFSCPLHMMLSTARPYLLANAFSGNLHFKSAACCRTSPICGTSLRSTWR